MHKATSLYIYISVFNTSQKCETLLNFQNQKREYEIQDFHAVKFHIVVSWVMTLCSLVGGCRCIGGTYYLLCSLP